MYLYNRIDCVYFWKESVRKGAQNSHPLGIKKILLKQPPLTFAINQNNVFSLIRKSYNVILRMILIWQKTFKQNKLRSNQVFSAFLQHQWVLIYCCGGGVSRCPISRNGPFSGAMELKLYTGITQFCQFGPKLSRKRDFGWLNIFKANVRISDIETFLNLWFWNFAQNI